MSCSGSGYQFIITRGVDNTFVFTIKANNSTLPIVIDPADTFEAILKETATDVVAIQKSLIVDSAPNGRVRLELSEAETTSLVRDRGDKEDRFYLRPVYSLLLVCNTVVNGEFLARINAVYVD
jgi:hypothetical protein